MTGYTIYYQQQDGGQSGSLEVVDTDTRITIAELIVGAAYSILIVANSKTFPSNVNSASPQTTTIGITDIAINY